MSMGLRSFTLRLIVSPQWLRTVPTWLWTRWKLLLRSTSPGRYYVFPPAGLKTWMGDSTGILHTRRDADHSHTTQSYRRGTHCQWPMARRCLYSRQTITAAVLATLSSQGLTLGFLHVRPVRYRYNININFNSYSIAIEG